MRLNSGHQTRFRSPIGGAVFVMASACSIAAVSAQQQAPRSPQEGYDGTSATYEMTAGTTLRRGERLTDTLAYTVWQRTSVKGAGKCVSGGCPVTFNGEAVWARASRLVVTNGPAATASPGVVGRIGDAIRRDVGAARVRYERGSQGAEVRRLQEALNKQGAKLELDGNYGRSTVAAIEEFQRKSNIKADGVAGRETLRLLGLSSETAAAPAATTAPATAAANEPRRRLERGSSGELVKKLQEELTKQGISVPADGRYGRSTERAVSEYQRKKNLPEDGVAGRETLKSLGI